jgi:tRNA(Ile)-lysidine synthase
LPQLEEYNPQVKDALLRTARISADDMAFIDSEAARLLTDITREQGNSIVIEKAGFRSLPPSLQRHLLRASIENLLGNLKDIEAGHVEDIINALDKPAGKAIGLPGGLNFTIEYDRYVLAPDSAILSPFPLLKVPQQIIVPGKTSIPGWEITADLVTPSGIDISEAADDFTACFDYDETGKLLVVRGREPGDRFQPLGMPQPKKLNRYMIDVKIPRTWRRRIPLVTSSEHVIWVVGWRIDERARVTGATGRVLRLSFTRV